MTNLLGTGEILVPGFPGEPADILTELLDVGRAKWTTLGVLLFIGALVRARVVLDDAFGDYGVCSSFNLKPSPSGSAI